MIKKKEVFFNLNFLKVLGIAFVVIYHFSTLILNFENYPFSSGIVLFLKSLLRWCVPIFLFTNGCLLFSKELNFKRHYLKCLKLILLFVFWVLINYLFLSIFSFKSFTLECLINCLTLKVGYTNYLWFIIALLAIYLSFPLLYITFHKKRKLFICLLFVCIILSSGLNMSKYILLNFDINLSDVYISIYNIITSQYFVCFIFFCLGGVVFHYKELLTQKIKKIVLIATLLISIACYFSLFFNIVDKLDIVWNGYSSIFTYVEIATLFLITQNIKGQSWFGKAINKISTQTFGIYFIHWILGQVLIKYTNLYLATTAVPLTILTSLLIFALNITISFLLSWGLSKIKYISSIVSLK